MGRSARSITGAELVASIEAQLPALRLLARVETGTELVITSDIRVIIGTRDAVRKRQYRDNSGTIGARKRDQSRDNSGTKAKSGSDLVLSGSGELPVPISSDPDLKGSARVGSKAPSEHYRLRQLYAGEYERIRGVQHKLAASQGGRFAKAAQELLDTYGFEESCTIIRRALADEWQGGRAPELWNIVKRADAFRGQYADKSNGSTQRGGARLDAYEADLAKASRERAESGTQGLPLWFLKRWPPEQQEALDRACMARSKASRSDTRPPGEIAHDERQRRERAPDARVSALVDSIGRVPG